MNALLAELADIQDRLEYLDAEALRHPTPRLDLQRAELNKRRKELEAELARERQAEEAHPSLFDDDRLTAVEEGQLSAIADYYDEEASAMTAPFCAPSLGRKRIKYNE